MRLIKMAGGLGNQMFIYAMYLSMHKRFGDSVRIDISDILHLHPHNGYELHDVFCLPPCEFRANRLLKKVLEGTLFRIILERHQHGSMKAYREPIYWPWIYYKGFYQNERYFADVEQEVRQHSPSSKRRPTISHACSWSACRPTLMLYQYTYAEAITFHHNTGKTWVNIPARSIF